MKLSELKSVPPVSGAKPPSGARGSAVVTEPMVTSGQVSPSLPVDAAASAAPQEGQQQGPEYFTSVTPSGIEVAYSSAPRRHYKLRGPHPKGWVAPEEYDGGWAEVPSVTNVLGVLEKPQLVWWGQKIGVEGVRNFVDSQDIIDWNEWTADRIVQWMTETKCTVNHQRDKAADRGVNVHVSLEQWCDTGVVPDPAEWQENERGYVAGLRDFMLAVDGGIGGNGALESELMVGSLEHKYAGRFDLVLTLSKPVEVVTKCYPKKPPKVEEIPAGRWICDLKTSKNCYPTHAIQLAAYRAAMVECGYPDADHMAVIHVTDDGRYEFRPALATLEQFLAVKSAYDTMENKRWFANSADDLLPENEREVLRVLKDELGAKEVS